MGDTVELRGFRAEIEGVHPQRGPSEVRFVFEQPLESSELLFMRWNGTTYEEFRPPAPGETVSLRSQPGLFG